MMFRRKPKPQDEKNSASPSPWKTRRLLGVSIFVYIAILVVAVGVSASAVVIHESDTNPSFCGTCHIMEPNVTSYLTSDNLDHVHSQAGVLCKDCHDYPLAEEIRAGVNFLTGNYVLNETGELPQRDFGDEICTQCHVSLENVARSTDFLYYNPHDTRMGTFTCNTCHVSHGEQIDYCSECHTNGGQRMIGDTTPRAEQLGEPVSHYSGMFGQ